MTKKIAGILGALAISIGFMGCNSYPDPIKETQMAAATAAQTSATSSASSQPASSYDAVLDSFYNRDYQDAIDGATAIMNAEGESVEGLTIRGIALAKLNHPFDAFADLIAATKIDRCVFTLTNIGSALRMFGYCARAADAYEQALALAPNDPQLLINLSSAYLCYGDVEKAEEIFVKSLTSFPKDAVAYTNASIQKAIVEDYAQAKMAADKALAADAYYKPAYKMLSIACSNLGDKTCADEAKKRFNELDGQGFRSYRRKVN